MNDNNFENRLQAIEYELSQIAESDYLKELNDKFKGKTGKDVVINIIPLTNDYFTTRTRLSDILDRLELTNQDRRDLEIYITHNLIARNEILLLEEKIKQLEEHIKYLYNFINSNINLNKINNIKNILTQITDYDFTETNNDNYIIIFEEILFDITNYESDSNVTDVNEKLNNIEKILNELIQIE